MTRDLPKLAHAWFRYWRWFSTGATDPPVPHPDEWANDEVANTMKEGGVAAWDLLLELVRLAPDDDMLGSIGSGPFEDWINEERAGQYEIEINRELHDNPRFRRMVRSAWGLPAVIHTALAGVKWED